MSKLFSDSSEWKLAMENASKVLKAMKVSLGDLLFSLFVI